MVSTWLSKTVIQSGVVDHVDCGSFIPSQLGQSQAVLLHAGSSLEMVALGPSGGAASICTQPLQAGTGVLDMGVLRGSGQTTAGPGSPGFDAADSLLLLSDAGRLTVLRYEESFNKFILVQEVVLSAPATQPRFSPRLLAASPSGRCGVAVAAFQDRILYLPPATTTTTLPQLCQPTALPPPDLADGQAASTRPQPPCDVAAADGCRQQPAPLSCKPVPYRHQPTADMVAAAAGAGGGGALASGLCAGPVPSAAPRDLRLATADALAASDPRVGGLWGGLMVLGLEPGCGAIWDLAILEAPCFEEQQEGQEEEGYEGEEEERVVAQQHRRRQHGGAEAGRSEAGGRGAGCSGGFMVAALVHRSSTDCGEVLLLRHSHANHCLVCALVVRLGGGPAPSLGAGAAAGAAAAAAAAVAAAAAGPPAGDLGDRTLLGTAHLLRATPVPTQAAGVVVLGTHGVFFLSAELLGRHSLPAQANERNAAADQQAGTQPRARSGPCPEFRSGAGAGAGSEPDLPMTNSALAEPSAAGSAGETVALEDGEGMDVGGCEAEVEVEAPPEAPEMEAEAPEMEAEAPEMEAEAAPAARPPWPSRLPAAQSTPPPPVLSIDSLLLLPGTHPGAAGPSDTGRQWQQQGADAAGTPARRQGGSGSDVSDLRLRIVFLHCQTGAWEAVAASRLPPPPPIPAAGGPGWAYLRFAESHLGPAEAAEAEHGFPDAGGSGDGGRGAAAVEGEDAAAAAAPEGPACAAAAATSGSAGGSQDLRASLDCPLYGWRSSGAAADMDVDNFRPDGGGGGGRGRGVWSALGERPRSSASSQPEPQLQPQARTLRRVYDSDDLSQEVDRMATRLQQHFPGPGPLQRHTDGGGTGAAASVSGAGGSRAGGSTSAQGQAQDQGPRSGGGGFGAWFRKMRQQSGSAVSGAGDGDGDDQGVTPPPCGQAAGSVVGAGMSRWDSVAAMSELMVPLLAAYDVHGARPLEPIKQVAPVLGVERLPEAEPLHRGHIFTAAEWLPPAIAAANTTNDGASIGSGTGIGAPAASVVPASRGLGAGGTGVTSSAAAAGTDGADGAAPRVAAVQRLFVCSAAGPALCLNLIVAEATQRSESPPGPASPPPPPVMPTSATTATMAGGVPSLLPAAPERLLAGPSTADPAREPRRDLAVARITAGACCLPGWPTSAGFGVGVGVGIRDRAAGECGGQVGLRVRPARAVAVLPPSSHAAAAAAASRSHGSSGSRASGVLVWVEEGGDVLILRHKRRGARQHNHQQQQHLQQQRLLNRQQPPGLPPHRSGYGTAYDEPHAEQFTVRPAATASMPQPPARPAPRVASHAGLTLRLLGRLPQPRPMVDFLVSEAAASVSGSGRQLQVTGAVLGLQEASGGLLGAPPAQDPRLLVLGSYVTAPVVARVPSQGAAPTGMWSIPLRQAPIQTTAANALGSAPAAAAPAAAAAAVPASRGATPAGGSLVVMSFLSASRALAPALDPGGCAAADLGSEAAAAAAGSDLDPAAALAASCGSLRDVTDALQLRHWEPTVAAGLVSEGVFAQITPSGLLLASLDLLSSPPPPSAATTAAMPSTSGTAAAAADDLEGPSGSGPPTGWDMPLPRSTWPSPKSSRFEEPGSADGGQQPQQPQPLPQQHLLGAPPAECPPDPDPGHGGAGSAPAVSMSLSVSVSMSGPGAVNEPLSMSRSSSAGLMYDGGGGGAVVVVGPSGSEMQVDDDGQLAGAAASGATTPGQGPPPPIPTHAVLCPGLQGAQPGWSGSASGSGYGMGAGAAGAACHDPALQDVGAVGGVGAVGAAPVELDVTHGSALWWGAPTPDIGLGAVEPGCVVLLRRGDRRILVFGSLSSPNHALPGSGAAASSTSQVGTAAAAAGGQGSSRSRRGRKRPRSGCVVQELGVTPPLDFEPSCCALRALPPPPSQPPPRPPPPAASRRSPAASSAFAPAPGITAATTAAAAAGAGGGAAGGAGDALCVGRGDVVAEGMAAGGPAGAVATATAPGVSGGGRADLPPLPPRNALLTNAAAADLSGAAAAIVGSGGMGTGVGSAAAVSRAPGEGPAAFGVTASGAFRAPRIPWRYHLLVGNHAPGIELLLLTHGSSGLRCTPLARLSTAVPPGLGPGAGPAGPQTPPVPESLVFITPAPTPAAAVAALDGSPTGGSSRNGGGAAGGTRGALLPSVRSGADAGSGSGSGSSSTEDVLCLVGLRSGGLAAFSYGPAAAPPPPPLALPPAARSRPVGGGARISGDASGGGGGEGAEGGAAEPMDTSGGSERPRDTGPSAHVQAHHMMASLAPAAAPTSAGTPAAATPTLAEAEGPPGVAATNSAGSGPGSFVLRRLWHSQLEHVPLQLAALGPCRPWQALAVGSAVHVVELAVPSCRLLTTQLLPTAGSWQAEGGGVFDGGGVRARQGPHGSHPLRGPGSRGGQGHLGLEALMAVPLFLPLLQPTSPAPWPPPPPQPQQQQQRRWGQDQVVPLDQQPKQHAAAGPEAASGTRSRAPGPQRLSSPSSAAAQWSASGAAAQSPPAVELALVVLNDGSWRLLSLQRVSRLGRQPPSVTCITYDTGAAAWWSNGGDDGGRRRSLLPQPPAIHRTGVLGRPRLLLHVPTVPLHATLASPVTVAAAVDAAAVTATMAMQSSRTSASAASSPVLPPPSPSPSHAPRHGAASSRLPADHDRPRAGAAPAAAAPGSGAGYLVVLAEDATAPQQPADGSAWLHVLDAASGRQVASFDIAAATGGFLATCAQVWEVGPAAGVGVRRARPRRLPGLLLVADDDAGGVLRIRDVLGVWGGPGRGEDAEMAVAAPEDEEEEEEAGADEEEGGLLGREERFRGLREAPGRRWWLGDGVQVEHRRLGLGARRRLRDLRVVAAELEARGAELGAAGGAGGGAAAEAAMRDVDAAAEVEVVVVERPPEGAAGAAGADAGAELGGGGGGGEGGAPMDAEGVDGEQPQEDGEDEEEEEGGGGREGGRRGPRRGARVVAHGDDGGGGGAADAVHEEADAIARRLRRLVEAADAVHEGPRGAAATVVTAAAAAGRPVLGEPASLLVVGCSGHSGGEVVLLRLVLAPLPPRPELQSQPQAAQDLPRSMRGGGGGGTAATGLAAPGLDDGDNSGVGAGGSVPPPGPAAGCVVQIQVVLRLLLAKPVTAVCPYDSTMLAVAAGRRLLFYRMQDGRLHRTGWHATRNSATALAACPGRRLLASTDGSTGVVLYDVVHVESDLPGAPEGVPVALRLVAADAVPRAVTSLVLLPPPPPPPPQQQPPPRGSGTQQSADAATRAAASSPSDASGDDDVLRAGSPPVAAAAAGGDAMDVQAPALDRRAPAGADTGAGAGAGAAAGEMDGEAGGGGGAVGAAALEAPPVVAATDAQGRLVLLSPQQSTASPCRNLCVLAAVQCPDAGLRLRALLPAPLVRYNMEGPRQPRAPVLLLAGLSGAVHKVRPCPDSAAPLLALLERALGADPAGKPLTGGRHQSAGLEVELDGEVEEEGAAAAGRCSWWCHHLQPEVLDGDHLEQLLDLPPPLWLQVVRRVPLQALRAALAAARSGREADFFDAAAAAAAATTATAEGQPGQQQQQQMQVQPLLEPQPSLQPRSQLGPQGEAEMQVGVEVEVESQTDAAAGGAAAEAEVGVAREEGPGGETSRVLTVAAEAIGGCKGGAAGGQGGGRMAVTCDGGRQMEVGEEEEELQEWAEGYEELLDSVRLVLQDVLTL